MGSRDHSITCETCGLQRGGLNNYQCDCDVLLVREAHWTMTDYRRRQLQRQGIAAEGSHDHSITCRSGGLNNYQCDCASVVEGNPESVIPPSGSITEEHVRHIILKLQDSPPESVTPEGDSPTVDQIDRVVQHVQDSPPELMTSGVTNVDVPQAQTQEGKQLAYTASIVGFVDSILQTQVDGSPRNEGFSPQHRAWLHELQQLQAARRATEADALTTLARFRRTVICVWCGNQYRSACPGDLDRGLQGSHCASDVVHKDGAWYVRGGYGSDEHDMHRYLFVANPPTTPADPVCDECISERLMAGDLQDTGLECEMRPADFGPRPFGTWGLVHQIRGLAENEVALRRLVDVTCKEHETVHPPDGPVESCALCAAIREYRKGQRWKGELEDGGEEYAEGCTEVAAQLRTAAQRLEELAAAWERKRFRLEAAQRTANEAPPLQLEAAKGTADEASSPNESGECPHCQAQEPSVWDDVLSHFAHPAERGLKMCLSPWRARCRRCSADVAQEQGEFCAQHGG